MTFVVPRRWKRMRGRSLIMKRFLFPLRRHNLWRMREEDTSLRCWDEKVKVCVTHTHTHTHVRESLFVCVCFYVWESEEDREKECESVCVRVCVCVWEREGRWKLIRMIETGWLHFFVQLFFEAKNVLSQSVSQCISLRIESSNTFFAPVLSIFVNRKCKSKIWANLIRIQVSLAIRGSYRTDKSQTGNAKNQYLRLILGPKQEFSLLFTVFKFVNDQNRI